MAISNWATINPSIKVAYTTKKFFNKYFCKLVVYAPESDLIDLEGNLSDLIVDRRQRYKDFPWGNRRKITHFANVDITLLKKMKEIRKNKPSDIKMRVESPYVHFYSDSEDRLTEFVKSTFLVSQYGYMKQIVRPENSEAKEILTDNAIIRKKTNGYSHKVIFRDGTYDVSLIDKTIAFLENLDKKDVLIPSNTLRKFKRRHGYIYGAYIYTNDPGIITFLTLIHPDLVRNFHRIEILETK